jgi:hypothetical protein
MTTPTATSAADLGDRTWRVSRTGRIGTIACFLFVGVFAGLLIPTAEEDPGPWWMAVAWCLFVGAVCWVMAFRPRVMLSSDTLVIVNPIGRRRIALADIKAVEPGYNGMVVTLRNGRTRTAWAVQKANISWPFRRQTRADQVAAAVGIAAGLSAMPGADGP